MLSKSLDGNRSIAVALVASAMMLFSAESMAEVYIGGSVGQAGRKSVV